MALLTRQPKTKWLHPRTVIYLLGLVEAKPGDTAEAIAAAERRALDTLRHCAADWGLTKIRRSSKPGAASVYREDEILSYIAAREEAAA